MGSTVESGLKSIDAAPSISADDFETQLREVAGKTFEPINVPWDTPQMRQRLWLLQVAAQMVGKSKQELGAFLDHLAADGTPTSLQELSIGLADAGDFCKALCEAAHARMVIAGAMNAQA